MYRPVNELCPVAYFVHLCIILILVLGFYSGSSDRVRTVLLFTLCVVSLLSSRFTASAFESESYVTTDGQSVSLSWYKAPTRGLRPDFFSVRNTEYV
jgi:hypothetical protein